VEAAWALLRWRNEKNQALYDWAMRIAARRGRARACVALARKLAGILYAMWRDGTEFDPQAIRQVLRPLRRRGLTHSGLHSAG
jgi:transposase